jgi:outer membrane protein
MNLIKKTLLVLLAMAPAALFAQNKFAHVNSQQLLDAMPEVAAANAKLDTLNQEYTNELKSLAQEYQGKQDAYDSLPTSTSAAIRSLKQNELDQMSDRIRQFQTQAQQDLQNKNDELFTPIEKKVKDAIKAVALENHYNYVFDSSNAAILYADDGDDITPLVKKKLGIKE